MTTPVYRVTLGGGAASLVAAVVSTVGLAVGPSAPASAASAVLPRHQHVVGYVLAASTAKLDRINVATGSRLRPLITGSEPFLMAVAPSGRTAYVTSSLTGVRRVSLATSRVGQAISLGKRVRQIAFSSDGRYVYVAVAGGVDVISTALNRVVKKMPVKGPAVTIMVTPHGRIAYLLSRGTRSVIPLDMRTNSLLGQLDVFPCGNAIFSPDGSQLYVPTGSGVVPVSTATRVVQPTIAVGTCPSHLLITPDGKALYASGPSIAFVGRTDVVRIRTATGVIAWKAEYGGFSPSMVLSHDGRTLFVVRFRRDTVLPIATATGAIGTAIHDGIRVSQLVISGDGGMLYAAGDFATERKVAVISTATRTLVRYIRTQGTPFPLALAPDGRHLFVLCNAPGRRGWLIPVRARDGKPGPRIELDGRPFGMLFASGS